MRQFFLYLCTVALIVFPIAANSNKRMELKPMLVIDSARQFDTNKFPRKAKWLGLYCKNLECEIKSTKVIVTTASTTHIDDAIVHYDSVSTKGEPVAIFSNSQLSAGKVDAWYVPKEPSFDSAQVRILLKTGKWVLPWGKRPLTLSWVVTPDGWKRYHVSDGNTKQFLLSTSVGSHYGSDNTPIIQWAGDLDGDGRLDILLSIPDDNCGYDERLYLSSNAGDGALLRKSLQLTGSQVACGC